MKILVIGDSHGRRPRIHFRDFDAIVCTGDVCDDSEWGKLYRNWFAHLKTNPGVSFDDFIKSKGITRQKEKNMDARSLKGGKKIMEYLNSIGKPVFFVPGNWDRSYGKVSVSKKNQDKNRYYYLLAFYQRYLSKRTNRNLLSGLKNVKDCQYQLHEFCGINFIGYGLSSAPENLLIRNKKSPEQLTKKQLKVLIRFHNKIKDKLQGEYEKRNKKLPTIFLPHNVPYNTKLDIIMNKDSVAYKRHIGSSVAREFVLKNKPLLCIGGHVHEHHKKDKLGKTICINAGFGRNANTLIELKDGKIKKIEFYLGKKH